MMIQIKKTSRKKALIISILGVIGLFFIVITLGFWSLKPLLSKKIKVAILETTDSLYYLDFKDITYDVILGNATILNVIWRADSAMYERLKKAKKMPDNIYQGKVNNIELTGLRPWTIFFSKKLNLSAITVKDPNIEIIHEKQTYNSFKTAKSPYQIISKFVESFSVEKITFKHINIIYSEHKKASKPYTSRIENLDLEVSDLLIDSTSDKDKSRFYYTKECIFSLKKIELPSKDSLNTVKIKELLFSTKTRSLSIKNLVFQPRYEPMQYGFHTLGDDRIGLTFKNVQLEEINIEKLFEEKKIYAQSLKVNQGNVTIFTDTRIFKTPQKANYRPYPHEAFKNWNLKFMIDTIQLRNFSVTYSEYNPNTKLVGNVFFEKVIGNFHNFTNDTATLIKDPHCLVFLKGSLMNKAPITLHFNFDLLAPNGDFFFTGNVSKMQMPDLNQVTESLGFAKAEKGFLNDYTCHIKGNKYGLNGSATMIYNDLNITILKKGEDKDLKKRKLLSFFANAFVIKNSNPIGKKPVRVVVIQYQRLPQRPFFYTLWKGILLGVTESVM